MIVSLDAPTDDTAELVQSYADRNVDIVYSPVRRGKAAALNARVAKATGEIVLSVPLPFLQELLMKKIGLAEVTAVERMP